MRPGVDFWKNIEPEEFFRAVAEERNRAHVVAVMRKLKRDPVWTEVVIKLVQSGQIEIRSFLSWLARELQPATYLEVGVRRGFSMAMVASQSPQTEIFGFDMWVKDYANTDNPGPNFVQSELRKLGYRKKVHFYNGDSHQLLPEFFKGGWPAPEPEPQAAPRFWGNLLGGTVTPANGLPESNTPLKEGPILLDLITIDGDHSLLGGYQDLIDTMPHCALGGVVVFDDIVQQTEGIDPAILEEERGPDPHGWKDLLGVWRAVQERYPNFRYFEYTRNSPGVGIAVRIS